MAYSWYANGNSPLRRNSTEATQQHIACDLRGAVYKGPNAPLEKTTEKDFDAVFWPFSNAIKNDKKRTVVF